MAIPPRALLAVALVTAVAAIALGGPAQDASAGSRPDVRAVSNLLRKQTSLFNAARWQSLWRTYTPRFRRRCSYRLWRNQQQTTRGQIGGRIAVRGIRVRVTRRRAAVKANTLFLGDQAIAAVRPPRTDLYVKIGRRWYDEGDGITTCRPLGA